MACTCNNIITTLASCCQVLFLFFPTFYLGKEVNVSDEPSDNVMVGNWVDFVMTLEFGNPVSLLRHGPHPSPYLSTP